MTILSFELPGGNRIDVEVVALYNAGYAGSDQEAVRTHIDELALLGVPAPATTPTLYPIAPYLASQADSIQAQHGRTSGEAEWALVIAGPREEDVLLTVACDHTDRMLEVHGVAWSKNASPDVLGRKAWRLIDVAQRLDTIRLTAHVGAERAIIQDSSLTALLPPSHWLDVLRRRGEYRTGTVLISGTVPMSEGVEQFSDRWEVELLDEVSGDRISAAYTVEILPAPIA